MPLEPQISKNNATLKPELSGCGKILKPHTMLLVLTQVRNETGLLQIL